MATQVFKRETFTLQQVGEDDPREVVITPLTIKHLRPFMDKFQELMKVKTDREGTDILFDCAVIAIQARNKGFSVEQLEEELDLPTIIKIVELAGGVTLDGSDPNQTSPLTEE